MGETAKCGCYPLPGQIIYCPLHAAAGELLNLALLVVLDRWPRGHHARLHIAAMEAIKRAEGRS